MKEKYLKKKCTLYNFHDFICTNKKKVVPL